MIPYLAKMTHSLKASVLILKFFLYDLNLVWELEISKVRNARNKQLHFSYIRSYNQALIPKFWGWILIYHIISCKILCTCHDHVPYHTTKTSKPWSQNFGAGFSYVISYHANFYKLVIDLDCLWILVLDKTYFCLYTSS